MSYLFFFFLGWNLKILLSKFRANIKILNLGPKRIYLGALGSSFEKLLSYLKSAPSNLSNASL